VPTMRHLKFQFATLLFLAVSTAAGTPAFADAAFQQWLSELWPAAQRLGVSRRTFEAVTRDLEPDLTLPDLIVPGRREPPGRGQPEFVRTPAEYMSEATLTRLTAQGRKLAAEHRTTLAAIEQRFGVPPTVILAIWGRETAYGGYRLPHNAVRVLATQAYLGRRKDMFREEFLLALKMLEEGRVRIADMRSSWAGAMGLTQFLPSDFYNYAVDFDGDGRHDIWSSVPDSLASAAKQLVDKGWQRGKPWGYEVRVPKNADCTLAEPAVTFPVGDWIKRGFVPAFGRKLSADELADEASLFLPAGPYGPGFLTLKNFFVFKAYNFADLYALFVGHLSDRMIDSRSFETPWGKLEQLPNEQVETMQRHLSQRGVYRDRIDGKAGMKTRVALGAYQKANGLKVDCWPTAAVLQHIQGKVGGN
jgi:lytic murein transglycosylase